MFLSCFVSSVLCIAKEQLQALQTQQTQMFKSMLEQQQEQQKAEKESMAQMFKTMIEQQQQQQKQVQDMQNLFLIQQQSQALMGIIEKLVPK